MKKLLSYSFTIIIAMIMVFNAHTTLTANAAESPYIQTPFDKIPNVAQNPTITAVQSGNWSNTVTWGGQVPTTSDIVMIPSSITVTVDTTAATADSIGIHGKLNFNTTTTTSLKVVTILVYSDGTLEVGTQGNPIQSQVTAEIIFKDTPIDTNLDPQQYSHGLVALGTVTMNGATKSETFMRLAVEPLAGTTQVVLQSAVSGWRAGDRFVIPDSRALLGGGMEVWTNYYPQWETRVIQSISGDGKTITFSQPLQFNHKGARDGNGHLDFLPHAANLTRNVTVRSENPSGVRGHVLFTMGVIVDVRYSAFTDVGRTTMGNLDNTGFDAQGNVVHVGSNQIGRYAVHFHHVWRPVNSGYQYQFIGNAITESTKWAVTVHDSHFGLLQDNVVFDAGGAGFVAETGGETLNVFDHNMVVAVHGINTWREADGRDGSPFWFRGFRHIVRNNVATDGMTTAQGIVSSSGFYFAEHPAPYNGAFPLHPWSNWLNGTQGVDWELINSHNIPIAEFTGNEAYTVDTGLSTGNLGTTGYSTTDIGPSYIDDFNVWNAWGNVTYMYPSINIHIRGIVARWEPRAPNLAQGIACGDYWCDKITIENANMQGMSFGVGNSSNKINWTIKNSYFRTLGAGIYVTTAAVPGARTATPPQETYIQNVTFDAWPGQPLAAIAAYHNTWGSGGVHYTVSNKVFVQSYQGQSGNDFQVFFPEQKADFIVPVSTFYGPDNNGDGIGDWGDNEGSPIAGLTNQQTWNAYGIAIAGAVAPCTDQASHPEVYGFTCPIGAVAPPPSNPTATLSASPTSITQGQASTLSWLTTGATSISINQGVGTVTASGTKQVSPSQTTTYIITATNASGSTTAQATVTVSAATDTTSPTVSITAPTNGSTVSGSTTTVSANAADNIGVVGVQFKLDGANLGSEDTSSSYSISWNTTTSTNGSHTLTAVARDAAGNTTTSSPVTVTVNNTTPDTTPPTISSVSASSISSTSAAIAWTTNESSDSQVNYGTTTGYGLSTTINASLSTAHSQSLSSLSPSTLYHYRVKSKDAAGNLATSGDFTFTTTSVADNTAPTTSITTPTAGTLVSGTVTITATASDTVGVSKVEFYIDGVLKSTSTQSPYSYSWDTTNGGTHACAGPHTHTLQTKAFDAASNQGTSTSVVVNMNNPSSCTVPDTTPPSTPTGLAATSISSSQINLSWSVSTDAVGVTGYKIIQGGVQIATTTTNSYQNTGLSPNTTYTYTVSAYDLAGNNSNQSASVSATTSQLADTTPPSTPTGLAATSVSSSQINLLWTPSTDDIGVTGYKVLRAGVQIATTTTTSYSDTGLTQGTSYTYTVNAFDAAGNNSTQSAAASVATVSPVINTPPSILTQPQSQTVNAGQTVTFNIAASGTTPLTYQWQKNGVNISGATTSNYTTPLTVAADNSSSFTCVVTNVAGTITTNTAIVTVNSIVDTALPLGPTNLTAAVISSSQVNLSWNASSDNIGVTGYKIFRGGVQIATTTTTTYSDTGLSPNLTYTYTVIAYDAAGNLSAQNPVSSANTTKLTDTTPPSTPTGLSVTIISQSEVRLSWSPSTDNTPIKEYKIFRNGTLITTVTAPTTTYHDSNLSSPSQYTYAIVAVDTAGNNSGQTPQTNANSQAQTPQTPTTPQQNPSTPSNTSCDATKINEFVNELSGIQSTIQSWGNQTPSAAQLSGVLSRIATLSGKITTCQSGTSSSTQFTKYLFYGMLNDSEVKALQILLIQQGFFFGTANGNYLYWTQESVKDYQRAHNLPQTGTVGPLTRRALNGL